MGGAQDSPAVVARIEQELELVELLARQMRRQFGAQLDLDDLRSAGREGLLQAARGFDESRGVPFRRWANLRIKGAMIDFMRTQSGLPRRIYRQIKALDAAEKVHEALAEDAVPSSPAEADAKLDQALSSAATAMAIGFLSMRTLDGIDVKEDVDSLEDQAATRQMLERVRAEMARLPDAERTLLQRHYFDDVTFEEAARELGLSKSWASRLHARAIANLGKQMQRLGG